MATGMPSESWPVVIILVWGAWVNYCLCGYTGLAEDMAQEAFLRAWSICPHSAQNSLRNWLYRIAVNATLDVLRSRSEETLEDEAVQMTQTRPRVRKRP